MRSLIVATALAIAAAPALAEPGGQTVYAGYCQACHQASGLGTKPVFPPLAGSAIVNGPPGPLIERVLNGKSSMPPFKGQLDNAQIAAAITYIRTSWGNHAGPVTAAQVAAASK
ncbi:MAG TPA: cytochrome c [Caulobacteraceae bacterium]|jgi:mono/diheme cytochrome c family protein